MSHPPGIRPMKQRSTNQTVMIKSQHRTCGGFESFQAHKLHRILVYALMERLRKSDDNTGLTSVDEYCAWSMSRRLRDGFGLSGETAARLSRYHTRFRSRELIDWQNQQMSYRIRTGPTASYDADGKFCGLIWSGSMFRHLFNFYLC
jgi:hypothetical protein